MANAAPQNLPTPHELNGSRSVLPSWLVSVIAHVLVFFFCMTTLRSCGGGDFSGQSTEAFRNVGIYVRDSQPVEDVPNEPVTETVTEQQPVEANEAPRLDQSPPIELELPQNNISIGVGAPAVTPIIPQSALPTTAQHMLEPGSIRSSGQPGIGDGQTTFFDIREKADRFIYLIDLSGSMYGARMRYASANLKASLRQLNVKQQFQVIFYNKSTHTMSLPSNPEADWYRATKENIRAAMRFIDSAVPDSGTMHGRALKTALRLRPQVLFFLTDGSDVLTAGELDTLKRLNSGRTRIHCIKFDELGDLGLDNWMKKLARTNGGTYRYRDVLNLEK